MTINLEMLNPLFWHLWYWDKDPKVRTIKIKGGSSAGKTHTAAQYYAFDGYWMNYSTVVFRKEGSLIKDSIKKDFKTVINDVFSHELLLDCYQSFELEFRSNRDDNLIKFKGLDKADKSKGVSGFKKFVLDEMDAFVKADDKEIRRRLRGMTDQKLVQMWNPVDPSHFLKELIDRYEYDIMPNEIEEIAMPEIYRKFGDTLNVKGWSKLHDTSEVKRSKCGRHIVITTTYLDNKWIVGGEVDGRKYGNVDEQVLAEFEEMKKFEPDDYQVYGLGNWGATKNEKPWFDAYKKERNVGHNLEVYDNLPLMLGFDFNYGRMAVVVGQVVPYQRINILDCIDGVDTKDVCSKFDIKYGKHPGGLRIFGDASGKAKSAIKGAHTNYHEVLDVLKVPKAVFRTDHSRKVNLEHSQSRRLIQYVLGLVPVYFDSVNCSELIKEVEKAEVKVNPETGRENLRKDDTLFTMDRVDALRYLLENMIIDIQSARTFHEFLIKNYPDEWENYINRAA